MSKAETKDETMTYSKAVEVLGFTTPKSLEANADYAAMLLRHLKLGAPLRIGAACRVLIEAAK